MVFRGVFHEDTVPRAGTLRVFTTETGALTEGYAMCYDIDYVTTATGETATDPWGKRAITVASPTTTNNRSFAGVLAQDYTADADGQWVDIYPPGSVCLVYVTDSAVTLGEDAILNFICSDSGSDVGQFTAGGFPGCGAVKSLETISAEGLMLAKLCHGPETGGIQRITAAAGAATLIEDGHIVITGASIGSNMTATLADGSYIGQKLLIEVKTTAITTSDFVLTTTNAFQLDGSTALASVTMNATGEIVLLKWGGLDWYVDYLTGATQA